MGYETEEQQNALISDLNEQIKVLNGDLDDLRWQLVNARRKPARVFKDYVLYKILQLLSRQDQLLPAEMTARFERSAAKRDPRRSAPELHAARN